MGWTTRGMTPHWLTGSDTVASRAWKLPRAEIALLAFLFDQLRLARGSGQTVGLATRRIAPCGHRRTGQRPAVPAAPAGAAANGDAVSQVLVVVSGGGGCRGHP